MLWGIGREAVATTLENVTPMTAAVLAPIFPLLLIAMVADRARISMKLRRIRWFKLVATWGLMSCLIGMVLAVVATGSDPIAIPLAAFIWTFFGLAVLPFAASAMFILVTHEVEEEAADVAVPVGSEDDVSKSAPRRRLRLELSWGRGE